MHMNRSISMSIIFGSEVPAADAGGELGLGHHGLVALGQVAEQLGELCAIMTGAGARTGPVQF